MGAGISRCASPLNSSRSSRRGLDVGERRVLAGKGEESESENGRWDRDVLH